MAIYLTTGAPGSGKTLFTLYAVEQRRKAENREVFYNGINELSLPWTQFEDAAKWNDLPVGAIIVIDEVQRLLRPRFAGSKVPEYVEQFETHRHKGYDIYLITQHPLLIDANVRRIVETHDHIMRKFGSKYVTVHQWKGVKENCDKTRADSISRTVSYPVEVYGWYKSAEVHTHKTKIPFKVLLAMILIPALFIAAAYFYYVKIYLTGKGETSSSPAPSSSSVAAAPARSASAPSSAPAATAIAAAVGPADRLREYLEQHKALIAGLPHTAPRYEALTAPLRVPTIRGCWITDHPLEGFDSRAVCMLDGGVYIYPPEDFVKRYLRDRFFIDWENPRAAAGALAGAAPALAPAGAPAPSPVAAISAMPK